MLALMLLVQVAFTASLEEFERFLEQACLKGLVSKAAAESMRQRMQMVAMVNLDRWRLASDAMIGENLFDLIQMFGTSNRADAMILGKRWSPERLFTLSLSRINQQRSDEGDQQLKPRLNFVNEKNSTGNRGEFFMVDDIINVDSDQRAMLTQPVSKLFELLNRIDAIDSPKIAQWQLRSASCLSRLDTILESCSNKEMESAQ